MWRARFLFNGSFGPSKFKFWNTYRKRSDLLPCLILSLKWPSIVSVTQTLLPNIPYKNMLFHCNDLFKTKFLSVCYFAVLVIVFSCSYFPKKRLLILKAKKTRIILSWRHGFHLSNLMKVDLLRWIFENFFKCLVLACGFLFQRKDWRNLMKRDVARSLKIIKSSNLWITDWFCQ